MKGFKSIVSICVLSSVSALAVANSAYITNFNGDSVSLCSIADSGALNDCVNAVSLHKPSSIAFNKAGTFAYITDFNNANSSHVSVCTVDKNTGLLTGCTPTGEAIPYSFGVSLNAAGTMAYISDYYGDKVNYCQVNPTNGTLSHCAATASGITKPSGIAFNTLADNRSVAYISNRSEGQGTKNIVNTCTVSPVDGALSACSAYDSGTSASSTGGMAVNAAGTMAYVASAADGGASYCAIDQATGVPSQCSAIDMGLAGISTLAVALDTTGQFAYIVNSDDTVSQCTVQADGSVNGCAETAVGFVSPSSIAVI